VVWVLLVESFDFRASHHYILVRVIPSCFHFAEMCLCQVSLQSRCSPRYSTSSRGSCTLFIWTEGAGFSSCGECDADRFRFVGFRSPLLWPVLDTHRYNLNCLETTRVTLLLTANTFTDWSQIPLNPNLADPSFWANVERVITKKVASSKLTYFAWKWSYRGRYWSCHVAI
jgi:hypothetical protein